MALAKSQGLDPGLSRKSEAAALAQLKKVCAAQLGGLDGSRVPGGVRGKGWPHGPGSGVGGGRAAERGRSSAGTHTCLVRVARSSTLPSPSLAQSKANKRALQGSGDKAPGRGHYTKSRDVFAALQNGGGKPAAPALDAQGPSAKRLRL